MKKVLTIILCVVCCFSVAEAAQTYQYGNHVVGIRPQMKNGDFLNICVRVVSDEGAAWFTAEAHSSYEKGVNAELVIDEFVAKEEGPMSTVSFQCMSSLDGSSVITKTGKYNIVFATDSGVVVLNGILIQGDRFIEAKL